MNGSVNRAWLFTDVLHDVQFAGCRPLDIMDIVAKHPESGPESLAFRNFDARFDASILKALQSLRRQAC